MISTDIIVKQGADFGMLAIVTDNAVPPNNVPLTGYTFRGQIRETFNSAIVLATFSTVAGGQSNQVFIQIPHSVTSAIPTPYAKNKYVYDFFAIDGSGVEECWLQGEAIVIAAVTK